VLVVVVLDRDREAHRGIAGVQKLGVVAAAPEAVVAPDLATLEPDADASASGRGSARVARRRVVLAAEAADLAGERLAPLPARPFGEDADAVASHTPSEPQLLPMMSLFKVRSTASPAPRIVGEILPRGAPVLARERGIDDRRRERGAARARAPPRSPRRCRSHRRSHTGASAVAFITSVTRLSIWPVMMTTRSGPRCRAGWRRH
jgi:hypothetical protein